MKIFLRTFNVTAYKWLWRDIESIVGNIIEHLHFELLMSFDYQQLFVLLIGKWVITSLIGENRVPNANLLRVLSHSDGQ